MCRLDNAQEPVASAVRKQISSLTATLGLALPDGGARARSKIGELQRQLEQAEGKGHAGAPIKVRQSQQQGFRDGVVLSGVSVSSGLLNALPHANGFSVHVARALRLSCS